MMLRASSQATDRSFEYEPVLEGAATGSTGVEHGQLLLEFTDAVVARDESRMDVLRERIRNEMGDHQLVDVCGVVANFHRMTRIADATGIPLDDRMLNATEDMREGLGVNQFGSAKNTFAT